MSRLYPKPVVDHQLALSITDLYKSRMLSEGNQFQWVWLKNRLKLATISLLVENGKIIITGNSIRGVTINLTHTACNFGGTRPWFICPKCKSRVEKLYLAKSLLQCRHCHNLTYMSCQASRNHLIQIILRSHRIKRKLFLMGLINSKSLLVSRPKFMHSSTYLRLRKDFIRSESCLSRAFYYQMDLIQKKINRGKP